MGGRLKKEETYVYLGLIHNVVQQKPTQHCKAIIFQFKKKKSKTNSLSCKYLLFVYISVCMLKVKVAQSCLILCDPMDCSPWNFQARILEWVAFPFSRGSSQPSDQTQVSHIAGRFFTDEPQVKPKNTGVGSLSLSQWILPTQELNRALLHCRQIFTNGAIREAVCMLTLQ